MKMNTENLLSEAAKLSNNVCSEFCMANGYERYEKGYESIARNWALKSIAYSAGIDHPMYTQNC